VKCSPQTWAYHRPVFCHTPLPLITWTRNSLLMYYCDSIHSNNPDKAPPLGGQVVKLWMKVRLLVDCRPRKKPFRSLVSLTSNTPQNNVAALEEKVFCFLAFLQARTPDFLFFFGSRKLFDLGGTAGDSYSWESSSNAAFRRSSDSCIHLCV
jgi:hypothetical protein